MRAQLNEFADHLRSYGFGSWWLIVGGLIIQQAFRAVGVLLGAEYAIAFWVVLLIAFLTWIIIAVRGSLRLMGQPRSSSDRR